MPVNIIVVWVRSVFSPCAYEEKSEVYAHSKSKFQQKLVISHCGTCNIYFKEDPIYCPCMYSTVTLKAVKWYLLCVLEFFFFFFFATVYLLYIVCLTACILNNFETLKKYCHLQSLFSHYGFLGCFEVLAYECVTFVLNRWTEAINCHSF